VDKGVVVVVTVYAGMWGCLILKYSVLWESGQLEGHFLSFLLFFGHFLVTFWGYGFPIPYTPNDWGFLKTRNSKIMFLKKWGSANLL